MAIDEPLSQALERLAAEERAQSSSPFTRSVIAIARGLAQGNVTGALEEIGNISSNIRQGRADYLLAIVIPEVQRLANEFERLDKAQQDYLNRDWPQLLLDAERRARETRGTDRIKRVATVLSEAASWNPPQSPDTTEEFMRIAVELDDSDVRVLQFIAVGQARGLVTGYARVSENAANAFWGRGEHVPYGAALKPGIQTAPGVSGVATKLQILEGELQSLCAKLHSFGLTVPVQRDNINNHEGTAPYAMLRKGFDFLNSIKPGSVRIPD